MVVLPNTEHQIQNGEAWKWRHIEDVIHQAVSLFNFQEIRPSILQSYHTLKKGLVELPGKEHSEDMESHILRLSKPQQDLCLRPEGTITVLSSEIANRARSEMQKVYYLGPMFRRNSEAQIEEINQLGAEIMGSNTILSDDEIIRLSLRLCQKLGFSNARVEISSQGCEHCRLDYQNRKSSTQALGESLCHDCAQQFSQLQRMLSNGATNYKVNHHLQRDFAFYSRTVFNILLDTGKGPRVIGGGGRYDEMALQVTGHSLPSVGFELNLDVVYELLEEKRLFIPPEEDFKVYLCQQTPGLEIILMQIDQELHNHNFSTVVGNVCADLQQECDRANRQHCPAMIILKNEDVREGKVLLKNFLKEHQEYIKLSDLIPKLTIIRKMIT